MSVDWVLKRCSELKAAEKRAHMIAYSEINQKFWGYLRSIPQSQRVCGISSLTKEDIDKIKKEYPTVWVNEPKKQLMMAIDSPYVTLDGMIAMANDEHSIKEKTFDVSIEILTLGNSNLIKARIASQLYGIREAFAVIEENKGQDDETGIEKATSSAIRKAFNYMGYGRFPLHSTNYGEDSLVHEFREFKTKKTQSV